MRVARLLLFVAHDRGRFVGVAFGDGLGGHDGETLAYGEVAVGGDLGEHDANHLLGGIHPEDGAPGAAPTEGSGGEGFCRFAGIAQDTVAEAEAVAGSANVDEVIAGVVADHQVDGFGAEESNAVEFSAVQHHLLELEVVGGSGSQAVGTGEVLGGFLKLRRIGQADGVVFTGRSIHRSDSVHF